MLQGAILNTDPDWYERLRDHGPLDEVNFWQPRGGKNLRGLPMFAPVLFRLTMRRTRRPVPSGRVVGFGLFVRRLTWPAWYVWELFGERNGVAGRDEFLERLASLARDPADVARREVGCVMIAQPTFLAPERAIDPGPLWKPRTNDLAYFDFAEGAAASLWARVREEAAASSPVAAAGSVAAAGWREAAGRVRVGQGTFRAEVIDAYGRACAVTREHSLPVLEAAHIRPYADEGRHDLANGLALRSDLHRLFDRGYVTVDEDHRFVVSPRLRDDFQNGRTYYAMQGRPLALPTDPARRPDPERLAWHREQVFERRSA